LGLEWSRRWTPADWEIEIADENFTPFAYRPADLVGLSAFTASANRAYEIAALYRNRGITTVLGGIHASMAPDEAASIRRRDCNRRSGGDLAPGS